MLHPVKIDNGYNIDLLSCEIHLKMWFYFASSLNHSVDRRHGKKTKKYLLKRVGKTNERKNLNINCKKTEIRVVIKKMSSKCKYIGDAKFQQIRTFRYLGIFFFNLGRKLRHLNPKTHRNNQT